MLVTSANLFIDLNGFLILLQLCSILCNLQQAFVGRTVMRTRKEYEMASAGDATLHQIAYTPV